MDAMVQVPIVSHVYPTVQIFLTKISGTSATCTTAFTNPDQTDKQVACQVDNVCAGVGYLNKILGI